MIKPVIIQRYGDYRTLWVAETMIEGVSKQYLKKVRSNHKNRKSKSWRWKYHNNSYYYDYDTIPDSKPKYYRSGLPGEDRLLDMGNRKGLDKRVDDGLVIDKLRAMVEVQPINITVNRIMSHDRFILTGNIEKAIKIARYKAWIDVISEVVHKSMYVSLGVRTQKEFWRIVLLAINAEGYKLSNVQTLRLKYYEYTRCKNATERLEFFLGKWGNQSRRVIGKSEVVDTNTGEVLPFDMHEACMYSLMMNPEKSNKLLKRTLHDEYRKAFTEVGITPGSYRSFCRYTNEIWAKMHISYERDGKVHFNNNYMPYIKAAPLRYANSLWAADGSSSKLGYFDPKAKGGKGGVKGLYVVWVFDVATKKVMGYSMGKNEHPQMVREAFAKAYKSSGGLKPMDLVTDNGSVFSSQKLLMSKFSNLSRTIEAGNSQANPSEILIKLQINSLRRCENWMYSSFHAKTINSRSNTDNMKPRSFPTYEEVQIQLMQEVERWNETKGRDGFSPNERYELMGVNAHCERISERDARFCFGEVTKVDVSYMRGFVNVTKQGVEYSYTIPEVMTTMKRIGKMTGFQSDAKVIVCSDDAFADLYSEGGLFIVSCARTELAYKSYSESDARSKAAMALHRQRKGEAMEAVQTFKTEVMRSNEMMPYEVSASTSKGKVKDDYNDAEEQAYNAELAESARKKAQEIF